ncbi:MAG: shikimate dehydrogenase, partial [Candidatus Lokiarchaeota archaeon]
AVNTIKNEEGIFKARNTDAMGARVALVNKGFQINNKNILILGAGGAARAISFSLAKECNEIIIANRTLKGAEKLVMDLRQKMNCNSKSIKFDPKIIKKELDAVDLLVNATPIGMFPKTDKSPLPKEILHEHLFVFDLIYNPYSTKFLSEAKGLGCQTLNGLDMLINQGAVAFEWWTTLKADKELMKTKVMEALNQDVRP